MTNNPTKYESNPSSGYRGVAVTRTGLTGQKHYALPKFLAGGIINNRPTLESTSNRGKRAVEDKI